MAEMISVLNKTGEFDCNTHTMSSTSHSYVVLVIPHLIPLAIFNNLDCLDPKKWRLIFVINIDVKVTTKEYAMMKCYSRKSIPRGAY